MRSLNKKQILHGSDYSEREILANENAEQHGARRHLAYEHRRGGLDSSVTSRSRTPEQKRAKVLYKRPENSRRPSNRAKNRIRSILAGVILLLGGVAVVCEWMGPQAYWFNLLYFLSIPLLIGFSEWAEELRPDLFNNK